MHNSITPVNSARLDRLGKHFAIAIPTKLRGLTALTLALGTIILGVGVGLLVTQLPVEKGLMAVAGAVILFAAVSRPDLVVLFVLVLSSTIFDRVPGVFNLTGVEWCIALLLVIMIVRILSNPNKSVFVSTTLDFPIVLFWVASLVSFINASNSFSTPRGMSLPILRVLFDYLIFFAVTNFVTTRKQLMMLVVSMFAAATVVAILMILQQFLGSAFTIIPSIKATSAETFGRGFNQVARINAPGIGLVFTMLWPGLVLSTTSEFSEKYKWILSISSILLLATILFSFDRNLWIGVVLAGVIFVAVVRGKSKRFLLLILVLVIAASVLVPLASAYIPKVTDIVTAISVRVQSLFAGEELVYDSSTQWRLRENELALAKISEYPILGVGPGGIYRDPWWPGDELVGYIHNGYLHLLLDLGLIGFLPFIWFSTVFVVGGIWRWHIIRDPVLRGIVLSFALSYIGILSSSVTSPRFIETNFAPVIGVILGIVQVASRLSKSPSSPERA